MMKIVHCEEEGGVVCIECVLYVWMSLSCTMATNVMYSVQVLKTYESLIYIAYLQYFANFVQIDKDTGLMRDKNEKR